MTNRAETSSPTASRFLATGDMDCPPELLDLAASSAPKPFGFVRAIGEATLETARAAVVAKLAVPILIGEADIIKQDAAAIGWDLDGVEIIPAEGEDGAIAAGIALFGEGRVAGLAKGQLHTDVFMGGIVNRAAGLRTGKRLVHLFAMLPPAGGRPLMISDAAVNVAPDIETRVEAALHMAEMSRRLGQSRPRIAVLSATESVLPAMPSSSEAAEIASRAAAIDAEADFAGPLSFDLAVSPKAVAIKGVDGPVAGMADGLVVPDIVSGNILFKSLVWFGGGLAAGLVLGGAIPIILTSRSDPPAARLASLALAAICIEA
ncbi:phosphate acyltransferase [Alphaproteobacteria bacterium]|jgi:phosphate acetyltransferase|nr:phosphate acyltransferase [Alphaproteobacteria bacterium]MDB2498829.1 phosphate acyltransferase [Alphaproteobacteria bacterium]MDC0101264.1 phosphate acyltransferase [Alphaproteobacteria bacterium]